MMKTLTKAIYNADGGMDIGLATSEPAPIDHKMGTRPMKVVAVMMQGRFFSCLQ